MQKILFSCLFAVSAALASVPASAASMDEIGAKQIYSTGAKADYLAGYHYQLTKNCSSCHDSDKVSDSQTEIDKKCQSCHGSYESLGQKDQKAGLKISAHKGHLSIDSCTTCHNGHVGSFAYCNNCHIFDMPMKFGRNKAAYVPEDLSIYKNAKPNRIEKADAVVIGGGGAGMVAAIELARAGKNVVLLEKMPIIGGSSLLATGGLNAAYTELQKAAGVKDDEETFFKDTLKMGKGTNDKDLVRVLVHNSNAAYEWFKAIGGKLELQSNRSGGTSAARMHYTKSGGIGRYMVAVIKPELYKSKVDVRVNSPVVRINKGKDGSVTGVLVKGKNTGLYEIQAQAVVLTSGSYANNQTIIGRERPDFQGMITTAQPGSHGDGLQLAGNVGAEVFNLQKVQIHPNVAAGTTIMITQSMRHNGGILVNKNGERFVNDQAPRNTLGPAILKQPGQSVYLIYDDYVVGKRTKVHEGYVRLGFVTAADSAAELAQKLHLPQDKFTATIKRYGEFYKNKKDADFGRKDLATPLTGRLYAIEVIPGIGGTLGGIKANTEMQVLDASGNPIKRLFAAGEVVGGWHGDDRYGGNAVCGNIVFGRIAAQSALKVMK